MNLVMIETLFSLCFPCFTRNLGYNVGYGERILIEKLRGAARERIRRWNFDTSQLSVRSVVESGGAPRNILSSFLLDAEEVSEYRLCPICRSRKKNVKQTPVEVK